MVSVMIFRLLGEMAFCFSFILAFPRFFPVKMLPYFVIPAVIYCLWQVIRRKPIDKDELQYRYKKMLKIAIVFLLVVAAVDVTFFSLIKNNFYNPSLNRVDGWEVSYVKLLLLDLIMIVAMAFANRIARFGEDYKKNCFTVGLKEILSVGVFVIALSSLIGVTVPYLEDVPSIIWEGQNEKAYYARRDRMTENNEAVRKELDDVNKNRQKSETGKTWEWEKGSGKEDSEREPNIISRIINFMTQPIPMIAECWIGSAIVLILRIIVARGRAKMYMKLYKPFKVAEPVFDKGTNTDNGKMRFSKRLEIRRIYRSFIRTLESRGVRITGGMTSEDILNIMSENFDKANAKVLRDIYIEARYNEGKNISNEQLKLAKEALRSI